MKIKISKNPNVNWKNNAIQFPRLIAELEGIGVFEDSNIRKLMDSMDLTAPDILNIVDRAAAEWDEIKKKTK